MAKKKKLPTLVKSLATKTKSEIESRLAEIKADIEAADRAGHLNRALVQQNLRWAYEQALKLKA